MGLVFPNSSIGGIPRIISVVESSGCPSSARSTLMSISVTLSGTAAIIIQGEIIRRNSTGADRCDTRLRGPGYPNYASDTTAYSTGVLDYILDYNDARGEEWNPHCFRWAGYSPSGTHTFYLEATNTSCLYGCRSTWGRMDMMVFDLP